MLHALKTLPQYFEAAAEEIKKFEVRKNDRPYAPGDYVALNEWNGEQYTGRFTLHKIIYILSDPEYCKPGYVVLGLDICRIEAKSDFEKGICRERRTPVYER